MSEETLYHVTVRLARGYEFVGEFGDLVRPSCMLFDEPAPLGEARGPNAAAVLEAAVEDLTAQVTTCMARNDNGRFRIASIDVILEPQVPHADAGRLKRCEQLFEDFCTVTSSVRQGIPVHVSVQEPHVAEADEPSAA